MLLFNVAASVNQWCELRGGANCLSGQWQMREWFKKLDWNWSVLHFYLVENDITFNGSLCFYFSPMFYPVRLSETRFYFYLTFVLSRVRVAVAHEARDCDFTLRETKATSETHLYLAFIDIFAHNHGSFWTDVDWDEVPVVDMWPKLDLVIIYVHFVFKKCFNISSWCQEAEVYFCTS